MIKSGKVDQNSVKNILQSEPKVSEFANSNYSVLIRKSIGAAYVIQRCIM